MKKITLLTFLFLTFLFPLLSAVNADYTNGIINSENVYKAAKTLNSKDYPNADNIIVEGLTITTYKPDGTSNTWDDYSVKIFTEKGRLENRTLSIPYSADYSNLNITLAEIINPDGTVHKVDLANQSRTAIDSSQMSSNIYDPNSKVLTVNIPDLKINDTLRVVSHTNSFKTPIPNTWSNLITFEGTDPIYHQSFTVIAPHSLPLKRIAVLDRVKKTLTYNKIEEMTGIIYKWEANNIPRIFPEPQMPALSSVAQRVVVSTISDWEYISKWYWKLCEPHLQATPEMQEKVFELIKNKKSDMDKITAIFNFVSQKVRYMGLIAEKESPGFEPHDTTLTFNNKYGVCRDKAALLTEMLRIADFKAYPVIIKVGTKLDKEVPLIWFNHAITCVVLNGKNILMDPTNEGTKDIFPAYLGNCSYIVAKPDGATLQTSEVIPANKNLMIFNTNGKLTKESILKATTTIECYGINDTLMRNILSRQTPAQIEELFDQILRHIIPSSKVTKLEITPKDLLNTEENIKISISYTSDNELIKGKANAILPINWIGKSFGFVNQIIRATGLNKRKYPLVTSFTCGYKESIHIKIDNPDLKVNYIPKYTPINSKILNYSQNAGIKNNELSASSSLKINVVEFNPKQYLEFKIYLKQLEIDRKKKIIFGLTQNPEETVKADSEILKQDIQITLKNINSWTENYAIERKILTYNGKKDFAEIRISFNPAIEDVKINNAEVIGTDGKVHKITKDEINIMDAAWNSSAPRYPEGKILVANLPSVEEGSTIKYNFTREIKNKPFYSDIFTFQGFAHIKKISYTVKSPKDLKFNLFRNKTDGISETITHEGNFSTYSWKAENIPAIKKTASLPPSWTFQPTIIISTENWKNYIRTLVKDFTEASENQGDTIKITADVLKDKKTDIEKITAIRDFAAKHIRRAGPNFTSLPLTAISKADTTLKDSYGNNSDHAVLIYSMLKSAGYKPEFIFVSNIPYLKEIFEPIENLPLESFFKDIIIKVKISDKEYVYLNDTNEYAVLGATEHQGCIGFNPENNKFFKVKADKDKSDNMKVYYDLSVADNGTAELKVTKKYFGNNYSSMNEMFDKMLPEDRSRYYQRRIANISQSAVSSSELFTDFKKYPGIERYSAKITNYSVIENNYYYFTLPLRLEFILNLDANDRKLPFFMTDTQNLEFYINTTLPEKYSKILISPDSYNLQLPNNSGEITLYSAKADKFKYKDKIIINTKSAIYSPQAYQEVLRLRKQLSSPEIKTFLLEK